MLPLCVLRQYNKGRNYALGNSSYCPQIDLFSSKQPNVTYLKLFLLSIFSNIIFTKKREIKISSIILQHSIICKLLSQSFQMTSQLINIFFIFLGLICSYTVGGSNSQIHVKKRDPYLNVGIKLWIRKPYINLNVVL